MAIWNRGAQVWKTLEPRTVFFLLLSSLLGLSFYYHYYYYYYHIFFSFLPSKAKGVAQKRGRPRKIHTTLKDVVLGWTFLLLLLLRREKCVTHISSIFFSPFSVSKKFHGSVGKRPQSGPLRDGVPPPPSTANSLFQYVLAKLEKKVCNIKKIIL